MSATVVRVETRMAADVGIASLAVVAGRVLFAAIFVLYSLSHFGASAVAYATVQGVPLAKLLVPASGALALVGGLSILLGYHARIGALLLVVFLVPVTFVMHAFWNVGDPVFAQIQEGMFLKNLSMLGGALLIAHFGSGPLSLDASHGRDRGHGPRRG